MTDNPDQTCEQGKTAFRDEDFSRAAELFTSAQAGYLALD